MLQPMTCISCSRVQLRVKRHKTKFCSDCAVQHVAEGSYAIKAVAREVKAGRMPRAGEFKCVDCGAPAQNYDHRDYTQPLLVEPVCIRCNFKRGPALNSQMRAIPTYTTPNRRTSVKAGS